MGRMRSSKHGKKARKQKVKSQNNNLDPQIKERKEEKRKELKEKLQEKLKIIRDRRVSGVNDDPFPEGAFERLKSNDIWEKVLGYLTEPSDVTSAYFACGTFAGILRKRRLLLMMPKVLTVLREKADDAWRIGDDKLGKAWFENWKGISLNARGVSKAWKELADFQLFESDVSKDDWYLQMEWRRSTNKYAAFEDEKSVDRLKSLISHAQNHSPIRNVVVSVGHQTPEPFFEKLLEFLQIHGRHVWYFDFKCDVPGHRNLGHIYEKFCEILHFMPNLKSLKFWLDTEGRLGTTEEAFQDFQRRLNQRPFPSLVSLQHLCCYYGTDESLLSQILRRCANLKSVLFPFGHSVAPEVTRPLRGLSLELFSGSPTIIASNQFPWPLKHLEINGEEMNADASLVFPAINRYRETLQLLVLAASEEANWDSTNVRLDLPHLKTLFIDSMYEKMGFDHLLLLKSLELVVIVHGQGIHSEDKNAKVKVKKYMDGGKMNESNVWQFFPHLKRILLQRYEDGEGQRGEWFHRPTPTSS